MAVTIADVVVDVVVDDDPSVVVVVAPQPEQSCLALHGTCFLLCSLLAGEDDEGAAAANPARWTNDGGATTR